MVFWGTPAKDCWKIEDSCLKLKCIRQRLDDDLEQMKMDGILADDKYVAFVSRRQCAMDAVITAAVKFIRKDRKVQELRQYRP